MVRSQACDEDVPRRTDAPGADGGGRGVLNSLGETSSDYAYLAESCLTGAQALDPGNVREAEASGANFTNAR